MKKFQKTALAAALALSVAMPLTACQGGGSAPIEYDGTEVQGVSSTEILIGNSLAKTGTFASVGVPFEYGMNAAVWQYNQAYTFEYDVTAVATNYIKTVTKNAGFGTNNLKLVYKNYDDEFNGATGAANINKLINDDKAFAIVGHFGTPTVAATLDDIVEAGIPMVYAATGISDLYNDNAKGHERCIFPVQPIYETEGKLLLARAFATDTPDAVLGRYNGFNATKVGVIYTTDDAGNGMYRGIKAQEAELPAALKTNIVYQSVTADASSYVNEINTLKAANCDVIVVAMNQAPFEKVMGAMKEANYNAKCITSYVSNNGVTMGSLAHDGRITAERPVAAGAWLDNEGSALSDYMVFASTLSAYGMATETSVTALSYLANSYAMAGYVAAMTFIEGLDRVEASGKDLTWLNYIEAMESAPIEVNMSNGSKLDYSDGHRYGVTTMSLSITNPEAVVEGTNDKGDTIYTMTLAKVSGMQSLDNLMKDINDNRK